MAENSWLGLISPGCGIIEKLENPVTDYPGEQEPCIGIPYRVLILASRSKIIPGHV